jgi:hypothetical protein
MVSLVFFAQIPTCAAEEPATHIEGYYENMGGFPRIGATVIATNTRTYEYVSTETDEWGEFELDLGDLESGLLLGDIIRLNGIDGEVEFLNNNFVIESFEDGSWISSNTDLDLFSQATTPSMYWGPVPGENEEAEEVGEIWGDLEWDETEEVDVVKNPDILTALSGFTVSCDFCYIDQAMYGDVLSYKIVLIFYATTEAPTNGHPASTEADPPDLVHEDTWDDEYYWTEIPYTLPGTGWKTISFDLEPPSGTTDWYGNARMEVYHWVNNEWDLHEAQDFWSPNPLWTTVKGL